MVSTLCKICAVFSPTLNFLLFISVGLWLVNTIFILQIKNSPKKQNGWKQRMIMKPFEKKMCAWNNQFAIPRVPVLQSINIQTLFIFQKPDKEDQYSIFNRCRLGGFHARQSVLYSVKLDFLYKVYEIHRIAIPVFAFNNFVHFSL